MSLDAKMMERLKKVVGDKYVSDESFVVQSYAKALDPHTYRNAPVAVIVPATTEEVSEIVKIANEFKTPIIPRGSGTDISAGVTPTKPGVIVMDTMKRMNNIIDIDYVHKVAICQPGVQIGQLNYELMQKGYFTGTFGPANSTPTLGGIMSNCSVGGGGEPMFTSPGRTICGCEVVLPTGEIIKTGSSMSKYGKPWYGGRWLGGPDLTGMFIGDPGMLGIKTEIYIQIFTMPQYWKTMTFQVRGDNRPGLNEKVDLLKDIRTVVEVFKEWEALGAHGIHSIGFWNFMLAQTLGGSEYFEPLARAARPGEVNQDGMLCVAVCGYSQAELDENVARIERVLEKYDNIYAYGDDIDDGNYMKWLLEKSGNWSYAHWFWGAAGHSGVSWNIIDVQWDGVVPAFEAILENYTDRLNLYQDVKQIPGFQMCPIGGGVKVVIGNASRNEIPEFEREWDIRKQLRLEQMQCVLDQGGVPIWSGPTYSRHMVDAEILRPEYVKFLKTLKDTLDPNGILSPGKFHFND